MIICKLAGILMERGMSRRELARRSGLNINTVVALTHTSMWHRNVVNRRYKKRRGHRAGLQMLRDAIAISGLR